MTFVTIQFFLGFFFVILFVICPDFTLVPWWHLQPTVSTLLFPGLLRWGQGERYISLDGGRALLFRGLLHIFVFVSLVHIQTMLSLGCIFLEFLELLERASASLISMSLVSTLEAISDTSQGSTAGASWFFCRCSSQAARLAVSRALAAGPRRRGCRCWGWTWFWGHGWVQAPLLAHLGLQGRGQQVYLTGSPERPFLCFIQYSCNYYI